MKQSGTAKQVFKEITPRLLQARSEEISVTRAAKMLRVSVHTVYRLIECGAIRGYQLRAHGWYKVVLKNVQHYAERAKNGAPGWPARKGSEGKGRP